MKICPSRIAPHGQTYLSSGQFSKFFMKRKRKKWRSRRWCLWLCNKLFVWSQLVSVTGWHFWIFAIRHQVLMNIAWQKNQIKIGPIDCPRRHECCPLPNPKFHSNWMKIGGGNWHIAKSMWRSWFIPIGLPCCSKTSLFSTYTCICRVQELDFEFDRWECTFRLLLLQN